MHAADADVIATLDGPGANLGWPLPLAQQFTHARA